MTSADDPTAAPRFFTDRDDPQLAPYHDLIGQFREMGGRVLNLQVPPETVRSGDVNMIQFIVLAAQHHPDVLDRLLFGIKYAFEEEAPLIPGAMATESTWKADAAVQRWLARINELLPWGVYFAQDHDVRFHMLFGDILHRDREALDIRVIKDGRENLVGMSGDQAREFFDRIIKASVFLLHFCRPAGLVPQPAIEALLAEFDVEEHVGWTYERIEAHFEAEVARGFQMRATPATEEERDAVAPWAPLSGPATDEGAAADDDSNGDERR